MQLKKIIQIDLAEPGDFEPIGDAMVQHPEKSGSPVCTAGRSRYSMTQEVIL